MSRPEKIKKLIVMISISYTWCVLVVLSIGETIKFKLKNMEENKKVFSDGLLIGRIIYTF